MASTIGNNVITSKMTQILSLEMAKNAGFLKIGSRDYFSDQINGKMRSGHTYSFVIPDAGNVVEGLVISPRAIDEKKVELTIGNMNNSVRADALELLTHKKDSDYFEYIRKIRKNPIAKEVKLADIIHNSDQSRIIKDTPETRRKKENWKQKYEKALQILTEEE